MKTMFKMIKFDCAITVRIIANHMCLIFLAFQTDINALYSRANCTITS